MSIKEMIQDHPQVGSDYNEQLGEAIKHAMYGAAILNSCADACNAEEGDMRSCIRRCSDASDLCEAFYRIASRRTAGNVTVIKSLMEAVIISVKVCAEECAKHDNDHCRRAERMCREVMEDVIKAREGMLDAA
ncbi:four-helix bundle copper-binding protein [Altererythrobacter sp. SALINAS58]|uniref:four-helix bundle copper-binding protein n=1 Tax=Alteripontixanthobacter muriae TaxID=2705546 RepID=UPI001575D761|nr:four-helix bundle copper-binding protein [Alteripontixanthobacter muriae]NTZ42021.1 four-helix bundle copper-binding protein [Alteripontixanthobacter muriae]